MRAIGSLVALAIAASACACGESSSSSSPRNDPIRIDGGARDAAPSVFCVGLTVDFCNEVGGPTAGVGWDGLDAHGGGTVDLVAATESSLPNALRSALPAITGGTTVANAQVAKKVMLTGKTKVVASLVARIGDVSPSAGAGVTYFYLSFGGGGIALVQRETKWNVRVARNNAGGDDGEEPPLTAAPPRSKWTRIKMEITLGRPNGSVELDIDGQTVVTRTLATHGDDQPLGEATFAVGLSHDTGATPAMEASFDDVTLDLEP